LAIGFIGLPGQQAVSAQTQDARPIVALAVQTELASDNSDHSRWMYYEVDKKPGNTVIQWVAETKDGDLHRVIEKNSQEYSESQQRQAMNSFVGNADAVGRQRKGEKHDDAQAVAMLKLLPKAFIWTKVGEEPGSGSEGDNSILHFKPDPNFRPPSYEARVFAGMAGEMAVNDRDHRIVSLKGRLIRDVKFGYGLFGDLEQGGTFDVERRMVAPHEWAITEAHIHIQGHALIFKSISEQEDDVKSQFQELTGDLSLQQAENKLLQQEQLASR
jgi:hypothetical protein